MGSFCTTKTHQEAIKATSDEFRWGDHWMSTIDKVVSLYLQARGLTDAYAEVAIGWMGWRLVEEGYVVPAEG
jgi:hypothetical protein